MKRLFGLLIAGLFVACQQDLDTYSGENFIYFDATSDSTFFSYAYVDGDVKSDSMWVWVRMSGMVSDKDREFKMKIAETNAEPGIDFTPLSDTLQIPAGNTFSAVLVELLRPEHLKTEERYIVLELQENENFKLKYPNQLVNSTSDKTYSKIRYKIVFSEIVDTPPAGWNETYFGNFSVKKLDIMCEALNMSRILFNDVTYVNPRREYIATKMVKLLNETPEYEEDGSLMQMGDMYYN